MTTTRRFGQTLVASIGIALISVLFASPVIAERWYILWSGSFDAAGAVELDSIAQAPGYSGAMAVWVYVHHGIETFDCSPPTNCIATSQLTYHYVDCGRMLAAEIQRIPMNLRGRVVATIDSPIPAWFPLVWAPLERDSDEDVRVTEIRPRHRELLSFACSITPAK